MIDQIIVCSVQPLFRRIYSIELLLKNSFGW